MAACASSTGQFPPTGEFGCVETLGCRKLGVCPNPAPRAPSTPSLPAPSVPRGGVWAGTRGPGAGAGPLVVKMYLRSEEGGGPSGSCTGCLDIYLDRCPPPGARRPARDPPPAPSLATPPRGPRRPRRPPPPESGPPAPGTPPTGEFWVCRKIGVCACVRVSQPGPHPRPRHPPSTAVPAVTLDRRPTVNWRILPAPVPAPRPPPTGQPPGTSPSPIGAGWPATPRPAAAAAGGRRPRAQAARTRGEGPHALPPPGLPLGPRRHVW
jgi:hypothetical protein